MTTYYVSAVDGNNADAGTSWALAKQTVAGALAVATANDDVILVDNAGAFTASAAITWTLPATRLAIISVNRSGGDAWATGGKESVGGANFSFSITPSASGSSLFLYGMTLEGGTNNNANCTIAIGGAGILNAQFQSCTFNIPSANSGTGVLLGAGVTTSNRGNRLSFSGCTIQLHNSTSNSGIYIGNSQVLFSNLTITVQASVPTKLFGNVDQRFGGGAIEVIDSDLSGFNPASSFLMLATDAYFDAVFRNCKLGSNVSNATGTWTKGPASLTLINCDSGDTVNVFEYHDYRGSLTEETSIYKDSGASFNSSGVSWKVVTSASCKEHDPFPVPRLYRWNTSTASTTFKVDFIVNSAGTALTDKEIWLEIGRPSSTSTPVYTHSTDRNANPITGTGADQTTSSATWTGATSPTKQYCDVTATPSEVGMIEGMVFVAKASATIYIDPQLQIT